MFVLVTCSMHRILFSSSTLAASAPAAAPAKIRDIEAIKFAILNAKSLDEVHMLENMLKAGVMPS